jgi:hypothetical protein
MIVRAMKKTGLQAYRLGIREKRKERNSILGSAFIDTYGMIAYVGLGHGQSRLHTIDSFSMHCAF